MKRTRKYEVEISLLPPKPEIFQLEAVKKHSELRKRLGFQSLSTVKGENNEKF